MKTEDIAFLVSVIIAGTLILLKGEGK